MTAFSELENEESLTLLRRARSGEPEILESLLNEQRADLYSVVRARMDARLRARLDASDIIQETLLEANDRLDDYLSDPKVPFRLWLRLLAGQKVKQMQRHHLRVQARDIRRERSIHDAPTAITSSEGLAMQLVAQLTSPSQQVCNLEMACKIRLVLEEMDRRDREVISLRHFQQLSLREAATALGISHAAACNRYVRAIKRLRQMLGEDSLSA